MLVAEVAEEAERREEKRNEFSFCILTFIPVLCFSQLPQRLTRLHFQSRDAEIRREKFRRRRNDIHSIDNTQTPGDERRNLSRKNEIHVSSSADSESLCRDPLGFSQCQKLWAHPIKEVKSETDEVETGRANREIGVPRPQWQRFDKADVLESLRWPGAGRKIMK
jgi:hypothetical protein